jgi:hypothetical protein
MPDDPTFRRGDARERTRRDVARYRRRQPGGRFWRSLALIGSVGWPIVLLSTGGALAGHYFDNRWGTGVRFTLMLLSVGAALGAYLAFRAIRGNGT